MHKELNQLIQSLYGELQQLAEMYFCLEEHHQFIIRPACVDFDKCGFGIHAQGARVKQALCQREQACRAVTGRLHLEVGIPIEKALPLLPEHCQPLIRALLQQNRKLLKWVLQLLHRNQQVIAQSLTRKRQHLNGILPGDFEEIGFGDPPVAPADDRNMKCCPSHHTEKSAASRRVADEILA